jgi:hypothetical protein
VATCASLHGTGRAATPKKARQETMEMEAQEISKIVMAKNAAFSVPRAAHPPKTHPKNSLLPTNQAYAPFTALPSGSQLVLTECTGQTGHTPSQNRTLQCPILGPATPPKTVLR